MTETWLQANRRIFAPPIGAALAIALGAAAGAFAVGIRSGWFWLLVLAAVGAALIAVALFAIVRIPRIAYDAASGRMKFYVRFGPPVEVPLEHVEAFLIGKGPIFFTDDRTETKETTTILVRIAERAPDYHNVTTAPLLAAWCGNQATIRGTWTEPLGVELVNRLNQRLYDEKQARAAAVAAHAPGVGT